MSIVSCEVRTYSKFVDTHVHDHHQLLLPLYGSLNLKTDHKSLILDDKHLCFIPANDKHSYFSNENNGFIVMDIPLHFTSFNENYIGKDQQIKLDEKWSALRFLLLSEVQKKKVDKEGLNDLLHYVVHSLLQEKHAPSIAYVNDNFDDEISLEDLSAVEHYNSTYYSKWFKLQTGMTMKQYVHALRLMRAKQLLYDTNLSIMSIAQEVGYKHQSSLTRLFKQYEGISPREYRNKTN